MGSGALRAYFTPPSDAAFEVAVFVSTSESGIFQSTPQVPLGGATSVTVNALTNDTHYFVGLGIRPTTGGTYVQTGPKLTAIPAPPIYVDAASSAGGAADGLTPATAFPTLFGGVLTGFANLLNGSVGANVWIREGTYDAANLPIASGVSLFGGFDANFDLATRDPIATPTVWNVGPGQKALECGSPVDNGWAATLDGIRITGNGVGQIAVDTNQTDPCSIEMRSVVITDMADRGIRLRNLVGLSYDVTLTNCQSSRNGADGLNGSGVFDYHIFNSVFAANEQEGLDLNALVPTTILPTNGDIATLEVTSSRFFGNGTTVNLASGLRAALTAPLAPTDGLYAVRIRGCAFERNKGPGIFLDHDYELSPNYSSNIQIRESFSRANGGAGVHLDLDGLGSALVERVLSTGNGTHGLFVTCETAAGLLSVTSSAFVGNSEFGVRAEGPPAGIGNRSVVLTHCLLASNFGGGLSSRDLAAAASSTIAYQQTTAFDANTIQVGNVSASDLATIAFASAPEEYCHVLARSGATLTLSTPTGFSTAGVLELGDDTNELAAATIAGSTVTLTAAPADFDAPGLLAAFPPGSADVNEDYQLLAGSTALATGMNGADAGPFGSPLAAAPGVTEEKPAELLSALTVTPALSTTIGSNQALVIAFSKTLNGASANAGTVRALRGANTLNVTLQTSGAQLTINAPGGGWGAGDFRIELDGLAASDGTVLSGALALPFQR
ncbi:MAG: hypothetical protein EXS08_04305 [Planctomycetes bacterium]|nr:hypothetical protein [Planctomycetota bacterium]